MNAKRIIIAMILLILFGGALTVLYGLMGGI